jgi:protein SCO1/2
MRVLSFIFAALITMPAVAVRAADPIEAAPPPEQRTVDPAPGKYAEYVPPELRDVGIDEQPGGPIPLDLTFLDHTGQTVTLGKYFDGTKPVVIQLGYFGCPQLCELVSQGLAESLKSLTLNLGDDYRVLFVSFDTNETFRLAAEKRQSILQELGKSNAQAGLYLLTGSKNSVDQLTRSVGFNYKWVPNQRQFSHPAAVILATPDGRVSRYLYGVKFDNKTFRLSLVEASEGKIGSTMDRILLTCFQFDGHAGKYSLAAMRLVQTGGIFTVLLVGGLILRSVLRERHEARGAASTAAATTGNPV